MAKESVVSTIEVLYGGVTLASVMTPGVAFALMVFCLLYTPCVAAVASIKRELGARWAVYIVGFQCLVAWLCAWIVRIIIKIL